jgi:biopolymer transport protein ExbD/biopolymer transport protein TolR
LARGTLNMRRFSQRGHLVTLSEINITPLLDLAFVLLIIFVITTPLLEQGLNLQLSKGGTSDRPLEKGDIRTVEINAQGAYFYRGKPTSFDQVRAALMTEAQANPNLVVYIRADKTTPFDPVLQLTDLCYENGLQVCFRTEPRAAP